ncbi:MAG: hypothetical protein WA940_00230 [Sphingopyxis sp.]
MDTPETARKTACQHCDNGWFDGRFGQDVECVNGVLIDIDEAHDGPTDTMYPVAPCHPMWTRQCADPDGNWPNDTCERLAEWRAEGGNSDD